MGSLTAIKDFGTNTHLLFTSSSLADMYVYDSLRELCGGNSESVIDVDSKASFLNMLDLVNLQPLQAIRWLFVLKYKPLKGLFKKYADVFTSTSSSCFLIRVESYKDFKECKEVLKSVNDIYLASIRQRDVQYLLSGYKISPKVVDFVAKTYSKEPEKIFMLRQKLMEGIEVDRPRQVVAICGEYAGSIARFAISLLNNHPNTALGLKKVYSNRIKTYHELIEAFGVRSTYNFLVATVKDLLDIKILYMNGVIYDSIRELPEGYDEKRLSKYSGQLRTITQTLLYDEIIWMYMQLVRARWVSQNDGILFIYKYYMSVMGKGVA